ncbi:MAG: hypothetical protein Q9183_004807, partial [Haloplaca sp. 2 TL-2023]
AWHQYISPSQSPKQSELYDAQDGRPRSTTPPRRKRSHDEGSRINTPERRSPLEAWHQYNTPRHSPHQSDFDEHDPSRVKDRGSMNRDSAVHVFDSPVAADNSPVRRTIRDSGYPETEASPVVGVEEESSRGYEQELTQADGFDYQDNALNISTGDGRDDDVSAKTRRRRKRRERSPSQSRSRSRSRPRGKNEDVDLPDVDLPEHAAQQPASFEEGREPSPVSSTTKDRSSVLFHSSPSTREDAKIQEGDVSTPSLEPPREDNSAMVNARAESLAALSGQRGPNQGQQQRSIFGGPMSDPSGAVTPDDHDGNRHRLNTITEYSPEDSPLHKKNREPSDVGLPEHGTKAPRRSGTAREISKKRSRARSPTSEHGYKTISTEDLMSRLSGQGAEEERASNQIERSRSRGVEQGRPSSRQSNMSSLVSGQPKQREYERRSLSGASNRSIESINAIIRTPPDQMRSGSGMSNRSSGTPPLRRSDRSVSGDLRGANRKSSDGKKSAKALGPEADPEIKDPPSTTTPHDSKNSSGKSRVREMADVYVCLTSIDSHIHCDTITDVCV